MIAVWGQRSDFARQVNLRLDSLDALYVDRYQLATAGRARGAQCRHGDQTLLRGTLRAEPEGTPVGEIFGSALIMPGLPESATPNAARMEIHNIVLQDGTLIGMGTTFAGDDTPKVDLYTEAARRGGFCHLAAPALS